MSSLSFPPALVPLRGALPLAVVIATLGTAQFRCNDLAKKAAATLRLADEFRLGATDSRDLAALAMALHEQGKDEEALAALKRARDAGTPTVEHEDLLAEARAFVVK